MWGRKAQAFDINCCIYSETLCDLGAFRLKVVLYDCDDFTRKFYLDYLGASVKLSRANDVQNWVYSVQVLTSLMVALTSVRSL